MKIAVGGMIAAGKSNLVKRLGEALEMPIMSEYREDDDVFATLLEWLYEGKANTEMLLQIYFLHDAWLRQKEYNGHFVLDRDII
jgi:deoxyadenosine/deoxycytidine kinase